MTAFETHMENGQIDQTLGYSYTQAQVFKYCLILALVYFIPALTLFLSLIHFLL